MVTSVPSDGLVYLNGLSTDKKPKCYIKNGSSYFEMDTSDTYFFDAESRNWIKFSGGKVDLVTSVNEHTYQYMGLSTDKKPSCKMVGNGSRFCEMDTGKNYVFDKKNSKWIEIKNQGGGGSCIEYIAGENITISDDHVISAIDTKYTAGENITIDENNVISASMAKITEEIRAQLSVGGVVSGQVFPAGTLIEDIIRAILTAAPLEVGKIFFGTVDNLPEQVTADAEKVDVPSDYLTSGVTHIYTTRGMQYEWLAYPKELGQLKAVYENGLEMFNLLQNYTFKTITVADADYYLYYYVDPVKANNDSFKFLWA